MTEPRDRIRDIVSDALRKEQFDQRLDVLLRELVDVIDANPELRRQVVRDALRSSIMSNVWMRP